MKWLKHSARIGSAVRVDAGTLIGTRVGNDDRVDGADADDGGK